MTSTDDFGKLLLIEDCLELCTKQIVRFAIPKSEKTLRIICLEKSPNKWSEVFGDRYTCHFHTDCDELQNLTAKIQPCTVLIDSVNLFAALTDWQTTLRFIEDLNKSINVNRLVIILHTDCLLYGNKMVTHLRYVCPTVFAVKSKESAFKYVVEIRNVLTSGKVTKLSYNIHNDTDKDAWQCSQIKTQVPTAKAVDNKKDLIHTMTSFKIAVEKDADRVKKDLILPYTETISNVNKVIQDYEIDDWDDEDPDDDLNI